MSRYILRFFRFIQNPSSYFGALQYAFFGKLQVIRLYRRYWLPMLVKIVRRKKKINIIFLAMNPDMWRYDGVYRKFANDARFNPIIVTAMRNIPDIDVRIEEQEIMVSYFAKRGFSIVRGYNSAIGKWINLDELRPDIIFHTQPYTRIVERTFEFFNHLKALHCYAPYSFQLSNVLWNWDNDLQQYCWKIFYVGNMQLEQCKRFSRIGNCNAVPAGYCFEEEYQESVADIESANSIWCNDSRKRIIWAPHHSIRPNEMFKVSSFLEIADLMIKLRDEYKDRVVFAFKPHPVLKTKLSDMWGDSRADAYYADWANAENSFDAQGDYHALFAGSDAMIHCSGSFIVEYLYTGKPVAYVYSKTRNPPDIGPIGHAALQAHYPLRSEADIRKFIDDVVLGGCDSMSDIRNEVAGKYLKSPNGKTFSENVYESIVLGLDKTCQIH